MENNMVLKEFRAESKRLLDMMIHSVYSNKEIFLRELISNASDALDKLYYSALTSGSPIDRNELEIRIDIDKKARVLTVSDNGCGMTESEMEANLGVIAKSGSLDFKAALDKKDAKSVDIIGQFGVGFYSAFMVASKVEVLSKTNDGQAHLWASSGADGFSITPSQKEQRGTKIMLHLKKKDRDCDYGEFLNADKIKSLIKKYSDYIRYKILLNGSTEPLNSMVPLWKKRKQDITKQEYDSFYTDKFYDYAPPLRSISMRIEGAAEFDALLYIPQNAPYNYYSKEFSKGLQLYASGVMIMEKCAELLPDYFAFIKGVVDSADIALNISREILQADRRIKSIAAQIEKRVLNELSKMQKDEPDDYERFFNAFGLSIKFGIYDGFGENKDKLKNLLMFYSSTERKLVSLESYISRLKENQKDIYYAAGESVEKIDRLPAAEVVRENGFEILYLTQNVDEFVLKVLGEFGDCKFKSVSGKDLGLAENAQPDEKNAEMLAKMRELLKGKVGDVRISSRLKTHAVCLTSDGELSIEMEKILNSVPNAEQVRAKRVLEINAAHPVFSVLTSAFEQDVDRFSKLTDILYGSALLVEGIAVDDAVEFTNTVLSLIG